MNGQVARDGGRWYVIFPNGDRARWGHGSWWVANFRLRRDAVAWLAEHADCEHATVSQFHS